jgi:hypothetical protein
LNKKLDNTNLDIGGGTMGANPSLLTCKTKNKKWKSLLASHLYINKFSLFKEYKKYNDISIGRVPIFSQYIHY